MKQSSSFRYGKKLRNVIQDIIDGVFTMSPDDAGAIAYYVSECNGPHIEIGTLQGGSAILAALAKDNAGRAGMVYTIDPFGWFPGHIHEGSEPSPEVVIANANLFGAADRIQVFKRRHPPIPHELDGMMFDTAFIDGDHSYDAAKADWDNLHRWVRRFILFHDIGLKKYKEHCGKVWQEACEHPHWSPVYEDYKMGVLERRYGRV